MTFSILVVDRRYHHTVLPIQDAVVDAALNRNHHDNIINMGIWVDPPIHPSILETEHKIPYKRGLMNEFSMCWSKEGRNMSMIHQISDEMVEVYIRQYPKLETSQNMIFFEEINRLRYMGWQLRYIEYDADQDLHLFFEKVDWRTREFYGLTETKYNNQKDIWWLGNTPITKLREKYPLERIVDPRGQRKTRTRPKKRRR